MNYLLGLSAEPIDCNPDPRLMGVGMIRSEYLCREIEEYVTLPSCRDHIRKYVTNVCQVFSPNDVWYRTTELITPEVNVLEGNDMEVEEKHYVMGLRGVRRGVLIPDTFRLELENIALVSQNKPNLNVLFPYIKDPAELEVCLSILNECGFQGKYGIMAEIPSAILLLDQFIDLGISCITVGINDLTALALGTYRGSAYHDPTHKTVLRLIERVVELGHGHGVEVSLGGYLTSKMRGIFENLGIDNLIVHYNELPEVLGVSPSCLPHLGTLERIKSLTKARIREREERMWRDRLLSGN